MRPLSIAISRLVKVWLARFSHCPRSSGLIIVIRSISASSTPHPAQPPRRHGRGTRCLHLVGRWQRYIIAALFGLLNISPSVRSVIVGKPPWNGEKNVPWYLEWHLSGLLIYRIPLSFYRAQSGIYKFRIPGVFSYVFLIYCHVHTDQSLSRVTP